VLSIWLLVSVLRKRTWRHELQQLDATDKVAAQGVNVQLGGSAPTVHMDADASWNPKSSEDGGRIDASASSGVELRGWRARIVQALTLAAVAMCLWALADSVLSTHGSAQKFWDIIDEAERQLESVLATSRELLQATKDIRSAFLVLWWRTTAGKGSLPAGVPANASALLQQAAQQFTPIILSAEQSAAQIQTNGIEALAAFEDQFKGSTLRAEDFEVPAVMSAFYALLGLGCVAGGWLALRGRRPLLLGWLTAALWLLSAFLLLFGAGVMNGGRTVTDDTCLYAEALALRTAQEHQSQVLLQNQLTLGLRYYFGVAPLPVHLVAGLIYGLDFDRIQSTLHSQGISNITSFLRSDAGLDAVATGKFNATGLRLVTALPAVLSGLDKKVDELADEINVATFSQLYQRAKGVLCCEWRDDVRGLFAAWTACGVVVMLLCAALSYRVYSLMVTPGQHANPLRRLWHELADRGEGLRSHWAHNRVFGAAHPMCASSDL
jgi:hypothetical protein